MRHLLLALAQSVWSLHGCAGEDFDASDWIGEWTCSGNWRARAR